MDVCAPLRVTHSALAAWPSATASSSDWPSHSAVASAPMKVSPAAVVSTALTFFAGKWRAPAPSGAAPVAWAPGP